MNYDAFIEKIKKIYNNRIMKQSKVTPLHYISKESFESVRQDITWNKAKSTGLFTYTHGDLRPNIINDDWKQTRERCGMVAGKEYCNNCVGRIDFNKVNYKAELIKLGWNTESTE